MFISSEQIDIRPILFVDLDGTLLRTDTLWESLFLLVKTSPISLCMLPLWIARGKAVFKEEIARRTIPDIETLPISESVKKYIEIAKANGSTIILATAAHRSIAEQVASYLGLFSEILATNGDTNLKSEAKAHAIQLRAGNTPFDYIGNATSDIPIWTAAGRAIIANPNTIFLKTISNKITTLILADKRRSLPAAILKEIRLHQWIKNGLIFLPAVLAHRTDKYIFLQSLFAFLSFSFCASGVYVLNDLLDATADRKHPAKRKRPFASGDLSLWMGLILFPALFICSAYISLWTTPDFRAILMLYAITTTAYSFYLKRLPVLDALVLAALYSMRLYAGSAATDVKISQWLAVFSMFVFVSLAFVKRYTELLRNSAKSGEIHGRGYRANDAEMIASFGSASGYLSVLVIGLYCYNPEITSLYSRPDLLLIVGILHLFWISRIWLLAHRGEMDDDPISFTLRDSISYIIGILAVAVVLSAL